LHYQRTYLLHSGKDVAYEERKNGSGYNVKEFFLPENEKGKTNIVICVETEEKEPIFEALRGWD